MKIKKFYLIAVAAFLLVGVIAIHAQEYTAESLKAEADKYFVDSDYVKAAEKYTEALEKGLKSNEDQYMSHLNLGFCLAELENFDESLPHYEKAARLNAPFISTTNIEGDAEGFYEYGRKNVYEGNYTSALENFIEALKQDPYNSMILYEIAWSYKRNGNINEAEKYFKKAIKENPLFATSYGGLGTLYYDIGSYDRSTFYYSIRLMPEICVNILPEEKAIMKNRIEKK